MLRALGLLGLGALASLAPGAHVRCEATSVYRGLKGARVLGFRVLGVYGG